MKKTFSYSNSYYENKDRPMCIECYKTELFLPVGGFKYISSTNDMISILKANNYQIGEEAPPHIIQEMYEMHLQSKSNHDDLAGNISFPKYSSDSLNDPTNSFHVTEMIFQILDGGRFVSDSVNLPDKNILGLLDLLTVSIKIKPG